MSWLPVVMLGLLVFVALLGWLIVSMAGEVGLSGWVERMRQRASYHRTMFWLDLQNRREKGDR